MKTILFILLISMPLLADSAALMRIDFSNLPEEQINHLLGQKLDITYLDRRAGQMDAILTPDQMQQLNSSVDLQPIIPNLKSYAQQLRDANYFSYFHSYNEILNELQQVVSDHPDIAELHDIGDSYMKQIGNDGYDIWALKLSDNVAVDETEPEVLYIANMHAREIITPEILLYFIHYLVGRYNNDPYVTYLLDNRELWLIPSLNPDGHEYVFQGDIAYRNRPTRRDPLWWRKNMRDNDGDGEFDPYNDGVDLNRNFGHKWGLDDTGSSPDPQSDTYRGTEAFSEPEIQVIRDFVQERNFIISLSYHSYSNLWLFPWGYKFEPVNEPDLSVFQALADSCVFYNNYKPQSGADLYLVNGDSDDWLYAEAGIYAFTPEVGSRDDNFYPDTTRIFPLILENLGPNLFMAYAAGEEPIVKHVRLADFKEPQSAYTFQAEISHPIVLTDSVSLDTSSFKVWYRSEFEPEFQSLNLTQADSNALFSAELPGEGWYGKVYYYVEALDERGRRGTSPRAAPVAVDSFYIDFETHVKLDPPSRAFALEQNYPNPFNSTTLVRFFLPQETTVSVQIFDIYGRHIKTLSQGNLSEGTHALLWDGTNTWGNAVASGVFYCRIQTPLTKSSIKLVYLK